jgi:hypothetical protein
METIITILEVIAWAIGISTGVGIVLLLGWWFYLLYTVK